MDLKLTPFKNECDELSTQQGFILWDVPHNPLSLQKPVFQESHDTLPGMFRMKALAIIYCRFGGPILIPISKELSLPGAHASL